MQITITGRHLEITPAIKKYIEEKLSKVERVSLPTIDAHVIVSVWKYKHIVEIVLKTNVSIVKVSAESEDMYATIDLAVDKLSGHLKKVKEKLKDHKHREPRIDELAQLVNGSDKKEKEDSSSVFLKQIEVKPMDIDEAKLQLDTLGYAFLIFRRVDNNQMNVKHKTNSGDYVVLEPDID